MIKLLDMRINPQTVFPQKLARQVCNCKKYIFLFIFSLSCIFKTWGLKIIKPKVQRSFFPAVFTKKVLKLSSLKLVPTCKCKWCII